MQAAVFKSREASVDSDDIPKIKIFSFDRMIDYCSILLIIQTQIEVKTPKQFVIHSLYGVHLVGFNQIIPRVYLFPEVADCSRL